MERKPWNWLSFAAGLVGALVVLGGTAAGIAIDQERRAADAERYAACMAGLGFSADDVVDIDSVEFDLLGAAAEICLDS